MPVDKISGMLGLCRKAGKLVLGFDITVDAIVKKKCPPRPSCKGRFAEDRPGN